MENVSNRILFERGLTRPNDPPRDKTDLEFVSTVCVFEPLCLNEFNSIRMMVTQTLSFALWTTTTAAIISKLMDTFSGLGVQVQSWARKVSTRLSVQSSRRIIGHKMESKKASSNLHSHDMQTDERVNKMNSVGSASERALKLRKELIKSDQRDSPRVGR